jgi:hypothetical protein
MANVPDWEDDDDAEEGKPLPVRKVEIENKYFEKLKARLGQQPGFTPEPSTAEMEEKPAGPVIYNDDGTVYRRPT